MPNNELFTAAQFIAAIPGTGGIVSTIAKRVGCTRQTAAKYIAKHPTIQAAYDSECEALVDMAESVLAKSIQEGNTGDAKWLLERLRREKYSTRTEHTGADGGEITLRVIYATDGDTETPT